ncbi:DUF2642 domain-containing protein [Priestia megaterium]|nr:DUF2642 domain-containing protein [Priestia megaterium]
MNITKYINKTVKVEISGNTTFCGELKAVGQDIMILYDRTNYLYIPLLHMHRLHEINEDNSFGLQETIHPLTEDNMRISYRNILQQAKGKFIEIYVTGEQSLHGYITNVLNDYLAFYSPVYKNILLSLNHVKWFTPYRHELTPYRLNNECFPVKPSNITLVRNFEEQLKKYEKQLVVFDLGDHPDKMGVINELANNIVELITANGESVYWKLNHLKSVHVP